MAKYKGNNQIKSTEVLYARKMLYTSALTTLVVFSQAYLHTA
jgi:hypothetical protein